MAGRKVVRYSEAFKRHVVRELEDGTLSCVAQAQERYGIAGHETIKGWVARFGRNHLLPKVMRVETPSERSEQKIMKERIRELEGALSQTRMDQLIAEGRFAALCEMEGWDEEAVKKKLDGRPLPTRGKAPDSPKKALP